MGTFLDLSLDASLFPVRQAGETPEAFDARVKAWVLKNQTGLGIPQAMPKYEPAEDGSTLGDFDLSAGTAMPPVTHEKPPAPPPTAPPFREVVPSPPAEGARGCIVKIPGYHYPAVDIPGYYCEEVAGGAGREDPSPPRGEGMPPLWSPKPGAFGGPAGRIPAGMRDPWDPVAPSGGDLERLGILASTHFDVAWGTPPDRTGLTWDATRSVYTASADPWGRAYRDIGLSEAKYPQAYKDPALGDAWGVRWVYVDVDPYRILPSNEAHALELKILAKQSHLRGSEPETFSGGTERSIPEPKFPITPIGQAPRKQPDLGAFAWVPQEQLPFGCPYPYPYLPVPQADYVSGRWLEPDYVPSIPLPYPYDQTPWRCGVPSLPGGAKKGGGGGPPEPPQDEGVITYAETDDSGSRVELGGGIDASYIVGGRNRFDAKPGSPKEPPQPTPPPPSTPEIDAQNKTLRELEEQRSDLNQQITDSVDQKEKERLQRQLRELEHRIGYEESWLRNLEESAAERARGEDRYALAPPDVGMPPPSGIIAAPRPEPPPPAGGGRLPAVPQDRIDAWAAEFEKLKELLDKWKKAFQAVKAAEKKATDADAEVKRLEKTLGKELADWEDRGLKKAYDAWVARGSDPSDREFTSYQLESYHSKLRYHEYEVARTSALIEGAKRERDTASRDVQIFTRDRDAALSELKGAAPWNGETGIEFPMTDAQMTTAKKLGYNKVHRVVASDVERGALDGQLRLTESVWLGLFINAATGLGEIISGQPIGAPDVYEKIAGGGSRAMFGVRDYQQMYPGGVRSFQVWLGHGGKPSGRQGVYDWQMFYGPVDRTWSEALNEGMMGLVSDRKYTVKNLPIMRKAIVQLIR